MTIRLTNEMRRIAINALLTQTFEKREAKAAKASHVLGLRLFKKLLGPKYKLLAALPKGWAYTRSSVRFNIGGQSHTVYLPEQIPFPYEGKLDAVDARNPDGIALIAALATISEIKVERDTLKAKANQIVSRFTTVEALAKGWPLIAPFLPKDANPLPALRRLNS